MTIPKHQGPPTGPPADPSRTGVPPAKPRRTWLIVAVAVAAVAVVGGVLGIVLATGGDGRSSDPAESTAVPTYADTPESTASPESTATPQSTVPEGEIWQWAIGRNLWTDPDLEAYAQNLGNDWGDPGTDANVHSEGFQLTADGSGVVTAVTLYNDEAALGISGGDSTFSAYQGELPLGLTWDTTASDLGAVYGAENQSGGYGTPITFAYTADNGDHVEVTFLAGHERDLPDSPIHSITVTR